MDSNKLDELLKKYFDCETSLEEEQELREFFNNESIPEKYQETASLFQYFEQQKQKSVDEKFEVTVVDSIQATSSSGKIRSLVQTSLRIAAGIAVLVTAIYVVRLELKNDDPVAMEDTFDDPKEAFEETKKALLMISKGFGRAEQQAKKINLFNEAQDKIKSDNEETKL
jgi:hypothetical protein